jgi:RNA polymerase sigma-70 factor, ECF subfamily
MPPCTSWSGLLGTDSPPADTVVNPVVQPPVGQCFSQELAATNRKRPELEAAETSLALATDSWLGRVRRSWCPDFHRSGHGHSVASARRVSRCEQHATVGRLAPSPLASRSILVSGGTEAPADGHIPEERMIGVVRRQDSDPLAEQIARVFSGQADFVWRSLRRLGVPIADVDDALQEVFLVVYRRIADYEDRGFMRAWIFSISRRVSSHYHRGAKRTEERRRGLVPDAAESDVEELVTRREAEQLVNGFLEELQEPQRSVFYLSEGEGLTAPEIAAALDVNLNTVYGRLRQARKRFEDVVLRAREGMAES